MANTDFVAVAAAQIEELRAENERLRQQVAFRDERLAVQEQNANALVELSDRLSTEIERLRAALREALEKATACAPADRLHELEPLWSVLGQT